jgi:hypothetical protein
MYHASSGHSDLHKSFPIKVTLPDNRTVLDLMIHNGVTIKELLSVIGDGAGTCNKLDLENCYLFIDNMPLKCTDPSVETVGSLSINAEGTKDGKAPMLKLVK